MNSFDQKLIDFLNSAEQRRFRSKDVGNHVVLYQDFNRVEFKLIVGHSESDEHNWIVGFSVFFWAIEISWNGRKKREDYSFSPTKEEAEYLDRLEDSKGENE